MSPRLSLTANVGGSSVAVQNVLVVGAGQMGSGIAQVAAQAGCRVTLQDLHEVYLARGMQVVADSLQRLVRRGSLTEAEAAAARERISVATDMSAAAEADLVIESATEQLSVKLEIFRAVDALAPATCMLASNTSSLSITELAGATRFPERVIGMHFMNPVPVMQLVELIRGLQTSDETHGRVEEFVRKMSKTPLTVKDFPGFVSNRLLMPMINEAICALQDGVTDAETIDRIMKLGANHPMGPLQLADLIGLDTCLSIMEVLFNGFGDPKYRPSPLLRHYVAAGWLGKKAGRGFHQYT